MPQKVKVAVFAVVCLAAAGVVVRSFLGKADSSTGGPDRSFVAVIEPESAAEPAGEDPEGYEQPVQTAEVVCGAKLDSVAALNEVAAGKEVVFILLAGESEEPAHEAARQVEEALKKISARGVRIASFTMGSEAADYARLVQRFSIESFPSIIVMGRGCGAAAVSGEITEAKLLRAFVFASRPPSSCGTSCSPSSGCGP